MTALLTQTFIPSFELFLLFGFIIFISQLVYAAIGFGSGMIAISMLALIFGKLELIVPFFIIVCLPTELYISLKDRHLINIKKTLWFTLIIAPPLFLGSYLLKESPGTLTLIMLGSIVVLLAIYYLFFEETLIPELKHRGWIPFFGGLSGILGGMFGISGPPLIFYFKSIRLYKQEFRAALMSIFLPMTLFRITFYTTLGYFNKELITTSLSMIPCALLGLFAGAYLHHIIPEKLFKKITSFVLLLSGLMIILRNM